MGIKVSSFPASGVQLRLGAGGRGSSSWIRAVDWLLVRGHDAFPGRWVMVAKFVLDSGS